MISGTWRHSLSFAVRFNNHFTGTPVSEELPVRIDHSFIRPVTSQAGQFRQTDGTYRFINLANGVHRIRWLPPLEDHFQGWASWEDDPLVHLPLADPADLINRDLWPLASAVVPVGVTAVRGRLVGPNHSDLSVRISHPTITSTRFTRTDDVGDFLFLLPQPLETNPTGDLQLEIEVENGTRAVTGGNFVLANSGAPFLGDQFPVVPGKTSRVVFRIT